MRKICFKILPLLIGAMIFSGCEDYLDVPPEASVSEKEIFGSYTNFQGYVDQLYTMIVDYNNHAICVSANFMGETVCPKGWNSANMAVRGDYWALMGDANQRNIYSGLGQGGAHDQNGLYDFWSLGSRMCNRTLENIEAGMLTKGSSDYNLDEAAALLKGQAYFFRAFLHWEIVRAFGSIPYLDKVFNDDELDIPRYWDYETNGKTYSNSQAVLIRVAEDCQLAAENLPLDWGENSLGRITKGAAYALKAKALLYAGSPLFNEDGGRSAEFDKTLMEQAAIAANEVIVMNQFSLAEMDVTLTPDNNSFVNVDANNSEYHPYGRMFYTTDGKFPHNGEVVFGRRLSRTAMGDKAFWDGFGRTYSSDKMGGNGVVEAPTQNFVDKFEMADGSRYVPGGAIDGGYDEDFDLIYNSRDRRMRASIRVEGDVVGTKKPQKMDYSSKSAYRKGNLLAPYHVRKFWADGVDKQNSNWGKYIYNTPIIRMADVYLMYAEAIFEAYGDADRSAPGATMTGVQALNMVRARAGQPAVTAAPDAYTTILQGHGELASDHPFRLCVRNDRNIELCFEGNYWADMRRWKRAELLDKSLKSLEFKKGFKTPGRVEVANMVFENRHYWLPFPKKMTQLSILWPQNPGW